MQNYHHLSLENRALIEALISLSVPVREIADRIGVHRSTIYREIKRLGPASSYRMLDAHKHHEKVRKRSVKPGKLKSSPSLLTKVNELIQERKWSPDQIAQRLRRDHPDDATMQVSHETIYRHIYSGVCGELKKVLISALRQGKSKRGAKRRGVKNGTLKVEPEQSIQSRPEQIDTELLPGHWEGDLIVGAMNRSCVGTLVERRSGWVILTKMASKSAPDVRTGFEAKMKEIDQFMRLSLTYDRGSEMTEHALMSKTLDLDIYFADPHAPWQRGRNENTNGLIRQFLPKGTDLSVYSQEELDEIAWLLNTRPRKRHDYQTPQEVYDEQINQHLNRVALEC